MKKLTMSSILMTQKITCHDIVDRVNFVASGNELLSDHAKLDMMLILKTIQKN